ncbi:MAG: transcriptional regulator, BadM/Rrf2 family [Acidobacteria bacterium]|nr:transcriptional regulator, BadM/Rrf2 family [Acidobacteriota bacterium]
MIFSTPVQYAIRAMTFLGEQEVGKLSSIREISRAASIPMPYLAKIINRLSRRRLVTAKRGPAGGVMLGRAASEITLQEIVEALGGNLAAKRCILGISECGDDVPCPLHESWKSVRETLTSKLREETVRDLVAAHRAKVKRIAGS